MPWLRGRVLHFRSRGCELLEAGGPALESRLHKEARLWLLKDYKHKRLASYMVHRVSLGDTLDLDTVVAPNLYSQYEVHGAHTQSRTRCASSR